MVWCTICINKHQCVETSLFVLFKNFLNCYYLYNINSLKKINHLGGSWISTMLRFFSHIQIWTLSQTLFFTGLFCTLRKASCIFCTEKEPLCLPDLTAKQALRLLKAFWSHFIIVKWPWIYFRHLNSNAISTKCPVCEARKIANEWTKRAKIPYNLREKPGKLLRNDLVSNQIVFWCIWK